MRGSAGAIGDSIGTGVLFGLAALAAIMLAAPSLIVVLISFDPRSYISFPPQSLSLRWYAALLERQQLLDAALFSLRVCLSVAALSTAMAVPAAYALVRGRFPGRSALTAFILSPLMVPGVVVGIAILFFGAAFGFRSSGPMLTIGLTVFGLPLVVRIIMARVAGIDPSLEEASANLGASRWQTFRYIIFPQIRSAVLAGAALCFIEAFDNVAISLFTASPRERPLPVEIYYLLQYDSSPLVAAVSTLEILLALVIITVVSMTIGLEKFGRRT
jgi:putative spermidine/putrescine transport system permease protein